MIVALLLLAGCSAEPVAQPGPSAPLPPDEWASFRNVDSCAILDETALARLGKVSARTFTGASAHNCVVTITRPDGTPLVTRAYVGERVAQDAKPVDIPGLTAFQDSGCTLTVKTAGELGIAISIEGTDYEKQCAQSREVATLVSAQLKSPPQNPGASPFHGKDPCQPVGQFTKQIGSLKEAKRPTLINCELTGTSGTLLISHEIENMAGHAHGEPLTISGMEGMRHQEPDQKDRCMVMIMVRPVLEQSYFTTRIEAVNAPDSCTKATDAANESAKEL
ncbi:hypothetical protein AOZ06_03435 [Kibdelosporangium phytohabitans]|uniref:DUF3558 domain-containing protein n=1 Tax=Kibdelosporangium phytohabitans TaxID=860235 RepID=A0A0N7F2K6_9PSEU|nr:hypothetical protein AOZ06_03435 [Kibdelosporangium phytohabitans]